MVTKPEVVGIK